MYIFICIYMYTYIYIYIYYNCIYIYGMTEAREGVGLSVWPFGCKRHNDARQGLGFRGSVYGNTRGLKSR